MLNRRSFTSQVQDSDGQSDSKHIDKESRDYLSGNSCENQSEDDCESTDDGLDLFTDHQVHQLTSCQWLCLSCMTSVFLLVFFSYWLKKFLLQNLIIVHFFFVLENEKQTLSYVNRKFEGDRNTSFFFSNLFCGSTRFSAPTLKITWAWEVDAPEITWYE